MPGGHSGWRCRAGKGLSGVLPWRPKQRPPTGEQCGGAITRPLLSVFRVTRPRSIEKDVLSGCASESETMGALNEEGVAARPAAEIPVEAGTRNSPKQTRGASEPITT